MEIRDMLDAAVYAAGLESEFENRIHENAARLFITHQIALAELADLDDVTLGGVLSAE